MEKNESKSNAKTANDATPSKSAQSSKTENVQLVYVGPPVRERGLSPYMIFRDGIPEAAKGNKTLEKLFVPVSSLNSAMEQTKKKGTALHTFYQKALKEA